MSFEHPGRVLIVDDDAVTRETLVALLDDEFAVQEAGDGAAAAELVDAHDFDVVITDYEMPALSGVDLLALIARRRPHVVGLLVTGSADLPEVHVALHIRAGDLACRVIGKPYDPAELIAQVRTATDASRQRRAASRPPAGR
jgi:DNA-binding NtrC family response regulator